MATARSLAAEVLADVRGSNSVGVACSDDRDVVRLLTTCAWEKLAEAVLPAWKRPGTVVRLIECAPEDLGARVARLVGEERERSGAVPVPAFFSCDREAEEMVRRQLGAPPARTCNLIVYHCTGFHRAPQLSYYAHPQHQHQ